MSQSILAGSVDQILIFRAFNTDGTPKTDLTSATPGLSLDVFRVGKTRVAVGALTAKTADDTAHADGAIRQIGSNKYTVDIPDAACAEECLIEITGSYTGGIIEGNPYPVVPYQPSDVYNAAQQSQIAAQNTQS